jgi:hypothetical protein
MGYQNNQSRDLFATREFITVKIALMKTGTYNLDVEFDQILRLVKQLTKKEKMKLSKELEKDIIDARLTSLLEAFKTDALDQHTIDKETEIVRAQVYAKSKVK